MTKEEDEERKLLRELGLSEADLAEPASTSRTSMNPLLATGLGVAFLVNVGILLSLPPVLRGKGKYVQCD